MAPRQDKEKSSSIFFRISSSTWRRFAPKGGTSLRAEEMPKQLLKFLHRDLGYVKLQDAEWKIELLRQDLIYIYIYDKWRWTISQNVWKACPLYKFITESEYIEYGIGKKMKKKNIVPRAYKELKKQVYIKYHKQYLEYRFNSGRCFLGNTGSNYFQFS